MANPVDIGTLVAIIGTGIGYAFREFTKHKKATKNGEKFSMVYTKVDEIDKKTNSIERKVDLALLNQENMQKNCQETVKRFDLATRQNQEDIKDLLKKK